MAILEVMSGSYDNEDAVKNVCNYIMDYKKTCGFVGGRSVLPGTAVLEMETVQNIWGEQRGRRMRHFILSFDDIDDVTFEEAYAIASDVAEYYAASYQIIFGVHISQAHTHIHFGLNTVSFIDGKKFSEGISEFIAFRKFVDKVLSEYGIELSY